MTDVGVAGAGMTAFESESDAGALELAERAAWRALDDAGDVAPGDVTSVHVGNMAAEAFDERTGLENALCGALGVDGATADRIENTSASGASAVLRAVDAVRAGRSSVALVVGVETMSAVDTDDATELISRLVHDREYEQGLTLPSFAGLAADRYLETTGADEDALAAVAVKNHRNGAANPYAQFQREITAEEARSSPAVADPLRLYDCCPTSDGAAAIVLRAGGDDDVELAGVAGATGTHAVAERPDPLAIESVSRAGDRAFADTGLEREAVDVACIHDAFTVLELLELEELGFYDGGRAWEATLEGGTALDGDLPVNPGGGLKARGHPLGATGVAQLVELTWQLRGDADARQVAGPETGLALNVGGFGNNAICTLLEAR
ncbi:acetyl-CoA C-acetyltransferase/acetyl-CoA acyltransferase [Halobiforma haloterrestris]|uniref:Acetyl-CoA C-acetyltransferase/acetyl-CoA acyltransferase n=1 Tax=Natronobacterium haloterrestre TaxID=148448 RepID=A0A1I1I4Z3_NATHA|nr:acetyl-CoA acyltransferase [Halobiforma haloterrestris]SFC28763.1 acetyl-CoA C-acetyltransferase/acetyl-CoA acyltransferase [Halobiforma haloterrestris]